MCLATVYVENEDQKEAVMQDVAWIKPQSGGLQLITLLGESRLFQAKIKSIDLMHGSIVLERTTTNLPQNGVQLKGESDDREDPPHIRGPLRHILRDAAPGDDPSDGGRFSECTPGPFYAAGSACLAR
jgi:predicted RNA-binding protein